MENEEMKLVEKLNLIENYLQRMVDNQNGWGDEGEDRPEYCLMIFKELRKLLQEMK